MRGSLSPSVLAKNKRIEVFRLVSATWRSQRERAPDLDLYCLENYFDFLQSPEQAISLRIP